MGVTSQLKARLGEERYRLLQVRDILPRPTFTSPTNLTRISQTADGKTDDSTPPHHFPSTQSVSVEYQRGTTSVDAYYDVALTILDGDAGSLLALAGKLPDEAKKAELLAFHERRTREAAAAARRFRSCCCCCCCCCCWAVMWRGSGAGGFGDELSQQQQP